MEALVLLFKLWPHCCYLCNHFCGITC